MEIINLGTWLSKHIQISYSGFKGIEKRDLIAPNTIPQFMLKRQIVIRFDMLCNK